MAARTVQLPGLAMHLLDEGQGAPVLLLHGLGSSGADWELVAPLFTKDHRVLMPDLRGHGQTEKPPGEYPVAQHARDVAALLDALHLKNVYVIGLSMGGMVAFQLAVDRPDQVRSLVIVNSGPDMRPLTWKLKLAFTSRLVMLRLMGPQRFGAMIAGRLFPKPEQAALREQTAARLGANVLDVYLRATRGLIGWSVIDRIGEIQAPVLVVSSERDYTPLSLKQEYAKKLKRGRVEELKDSGHAASADQPVALVALITPFLKAS
jgi:pimeloyl-ACP methyl ester carboxylesterase